MIVRRAKRDGRAQREDWDRTRRRRLSRVVGLGKRVTAQLSTAAGGQYPGQDTVGRRVALGTGSRLEVEEVCSCLLSSAASA